MADALNRWELPVAGGSHNGPRRWRVDGGEGVLLCLRCTCGGVFGLPHRRCRRHQAHNPREKARKDGKDQAGQHKHVAQIRLQVGVWQAWVFHINDSIRRRTRSACQPPQAIGLRTVLWLPGGIDLPVTLRVECGLNSRQINHLQQVASERHYRGQSAGRGRPIQNAGRGRRGRGPAPGQLPDTPPQGGAQDPRLPHHPQR